MPLKLLNYRVRDVQFNSVSALHGDCLELDRNELQARLRVQESRIAQVQVHLAHPGDSTRLLCCKDVIQPRLRLAGESPAEGAVGVLEGLAVVTCGPIVGFQEGVIDMSGPGASYTPFSELHLVALEIDVAPGTTPHDHEAILRRAGLEAAAYLGELCRNVDPDEVRELVWNETAVDEDLPRIAFVCMVLTQGLLHDTYVQGENAVGVLPRILDPRIVLDSGVVSGNCVSACNKNTTYHHQNNPLILRLLDGHGKRWNFVGLVMTKAPVRLAEKRQAADQAVVLARQLGAQAVVASKEGFGNPDADLMMIIHGLESAGVPVVALTDEFAGTDGGSQSLADTVEQADAIVSTGNANARIRLPAMSRTIGPQPDVARLAGGYAGSLADDGCLEVELQAVMGATNEMGFSRLTCREI
jgi:glycine reductase